MTIKRLLYISAIVFLAVNARAAENADTTTQNKVWKYVPEFTGTFRSFYRLNTDTGSSRFEVANARLGAGGYVMPWLDYYFQVDFCNRGKITILDAFARFYPMAGLTVYMGQMRVPFSAESSRFPWKYRFADVGMPAYLGNLRSVGVKAGYNIPGTEGLYVEAGVFNSTDKADHNSWNTALTYGIRLNYTSKITGLRPEISFMSRKGDSTTDRRINMANASISYTGNRLFAEAEYIYRYYGDANLRPDHAYNVVADYGIPLRARMANKLSFQARYDGIAGNNTAWWPTHSRITAGVTVAQTYGKRLLMAFRLNYEYYIYSDTATFPAAIKHDNELIAGVTVHF